MENRSKEFLKNIEKLFLAFMNYAKKIKLIKFKIFFCVLFIYWSFVWKYLYFMVRLNLKIRKPENFGKFADFGLIMWIVGEFFQKQLNTSDFH